MDLGGVKLATYPRHPVILSDIGWGVLRIEVP